MINLSVIIAAYNVETFIEKCVSSCYDKDFWEVTEILVIDDGSTDKTLDIVKKMQSNMPNLKVLLQTNQGLGASRNNGLLSAKGKYIWMIDGDDFIEPGSLKIVLQYIKTDQDLYCVNYNVREENGNVLYKAYPNHYITDVLSGSDYYKLNYKKNYTWQFIFKKELFLNHHIFFKERINMQDSEILPKLINHIKAVKYIDRVAYNYVQYQNSYTNTQDGSRRFKYFQSIIEVRDSLAEFGKSIIETNPELHATIQKKITSLNQVVFDHLVFYKYNSKNFSKNIILLKKAGLYPITNRAEGKMRWIKWGINNFPLTTNMLFNLIKK